MAVAAAATAATAAADADCEEVSMLVAKQVPGQAAGGHPWDWEEGKRNIWHMDSENDRAIAIYLFRDPTVWVQPRAGLH